MFRQRTHEATVHGCDYNVLLRQIAWIFTRKTPPLLINQTDIAYLGYTQLYNGYWYNCMYICVQHGCVINLFA